MAPPTDRFPQRRASLRLILLVPFILQTAAAVGITGYISWRSSQSNLNDLIIRLQKASTQQVEQRLNTYLNTPKQLAQSTADAFASGLLNEQDTEGIGRHLHSQVKRYKAGYSSFASFSGNYFAAGYMTDTGRDRISRDLLSFEKYGDRKNHIYNTNDQGQLTNLTLVEDYDFQSEFWVANIAKSPSPKANWAPISPWESSPFPLSLSAVVPIYNSTHTLIGVASVDQRLTQISRFLQESKPSPGTEVFIIERDGNLVASSGQQPVYKLTNQKLDRLPALQSTNPLIQTTSHFLQQKFHSFQNIDTQTASIYNLKGIQQFVYTTTWKDDWGLEWLVVVVMPATDFTAQIQENTKQTIILSVLALFGAIILSLYTSQWIIRPILRLKNAAQFLASGNLEYQAAPSSINELDKLGQAFNQMADQLNLSFQALEASNNDLEQRVADRTETLTQTLTTLQTTQAQLIQTEKMSSLGQMVAGVMHEINNPTTFIQGNLGHCAQYLQTFSALIGLYQKHYPHPPEAIAQALETQDLPFILADWPKLLSSMQQGTSRIQAIVTSLQDFSYINESASKTINLNHGLESTLLILTHQLTSHNIQIVKKYSDLPSLQCYPSLLNQVFHSLITNAIDAQATSITLSTSYHCDQIIVTITDNGSGIPPEIQAKIFDPFFTTKPIGKGTGLGLSIAYQIITQQHRGQLTVASSHQGTVFTITLPIKNPMINGVHLKVLSSGADGSRTRVQTGY
jgi:signal transduction histidine kinase